MSDQLEKHYFIDSRYIGIGKQYEKYCENARSTNLSESLFDHDEFVKAHTLLLGVIGTMLEDNANMPVSGNETDKRRFVLTAAFIQGISFCEGSILQSLYLQAGTLIRQEFENIGLITEVNVNKRSDGKQVNARHAPWKGSKHYGELSALAHLSNHKILESILGCKNTWGDFSSTVPQYKKETTSRLYGFHLAMVLNFVYELKDLYFDMYKYDLDESQYAVLDNVSGILKQNGIFKAQQN